MPCGNRKNFYIYFFDFAGSAVLLCAFAYSVVTRDYSPTARILSAISTVISIIIYYGFVDRFFAGDLPKQHRESCTPPYTYIKIFICFFALSVISLLLIYCFRFCKGYSRGFTSSLQIWMETDAKHYIDIAKDGYIPYGDRSRVVQLVFLPGYPLVIKILSLFTGEYFYTAFAISILCFCLCGCMFYKLLRLDYSHRQAVKAVKYLAVFPSAYFFRGAMSESVFLLCRLCCVYFYRRKMPLPSGLFGFYAAFTRSVGISLVVIIIVDFITNYKKETSVKDFLSALCPSVMTAGGFFAYLAINYNVSGDCFKFMQYQQKNWNQGFGWFFNTVAYQTDYLIGYVKDGSPTALGLWAVNLFTIFFVLTVIMLTVKKLPLSYLAWFIGYFFVTIGATWLLSGPRYMAVMFTVPTALMLLSENKNTDRLLSCICISGYLIYLYSFAMRWGVW